MGNLCACLLPEPVKKKTRLVKRLPSQAATSSGSARWSRVRSSSTKSSKYDDALIREHALAAAILFQQHNGSAPFDRSASLRYPNGAAGAASKRQSLPRSSSSKSRSLTDPLLRPHQLVNQDINIDDLETHHFVLVHGGGFGAWCWYKTIALLEECGYKVTAIDLTGSGIHSFDTNSITSLSQYVKPLTEFLESLSEEEKVILVGHDFGGACISYAMEMFPHKICKSVFVAAVMLINGQNALDVLLKQGGSNGIAQRAQKFVYGNGNGVPPTAIELEKSLLRDLLFNHTPTKDIALASVSMRPIPFAPLLERLTLSEANYGSVRRFYIETLDDNALTLTLQEDMVKSVPAERVFHLKGTDHSPFFSKPQALHKVLVEISKVSSLG